MNADTDVTVGAQVVEGNSSTRASSYPLMAAIPAPVNQANKRQRVENPRPTAGDFTVNIDGKEYGVWLWPDAIHMPMPYGFKFPRVETEAVFYYFTKGDPSLGIRPFMHSSFKARYLDRVDHQYFSKAKLVFQQVVRFALGKESYDTECELRANHNVSDTDLADIFTQGFRALVTFITESEGTNLHNPQYMSYMTIYDHYARIERNKRIKVSPAQEEIASPSPN